MKEERRGFERVDSLVAVRYNSKTGQINGYSLTKDVSESGIGLPVGGKIPSGMELELRIMLDGAAKREISATARVAWSRRNLQHWKSRYSAGLKLLDINEADRENLMKYVRGHRWIKSDFERSLEENKVPVLSRRGDF